MGGNTTDSINGHGQLSIKNALEIARNSDGPLDPALSNYLENELRVLWGRLNSQPDTYVFSNDEFSLYNYFRQRLNNTEVGQRAVARFWAQYRGDPNEIQLD
jgi:hypothetical protein